jgi:hypothetical protein
MNSSSAAAESNTTARLYELKGGLYIKPPRTDPAALVIEYRAGPVTEYLVREVQEIIGNYGLQTDAVDLHVRERKHPRYTRIAITCRVVATVAQMDGVRNDFRSAILDVPGLPDGWVQGIYAKYDKYHP